MTIKNIQAFERVSNARLLDSIRVDASHAYQQRIPAATQGDITKTFDALMEFRPEMNEFLDALVNRIGDVVIRSKSWSNPLGRFKRGMMQYGDTIEEIALDLLKAKRYDPNCCYEDVFKCNPPEVMTNFHTINRQDRYDLTLNEVMLRRAFLSEYGLSDLIEREMNTLYTSDYWDEYLIMRNLFTEYARIDGFYKVQVPDLSTAVTPDQRQQVSLQITEAIRTMTGKLQFLSTMYNAGGMPTFTRPSELVLFAEPAFIAALDVNVIAFAFNASAASVPERIIMLDEIPIDGVQAILCDTDIFMCADTLMEFRSIENPKGLSWNYFWHHHGLYSMSRFVTAVAFTTEVGTMTTVPEITINNVKIEVVDHDPAHCSCCHKPYITAKTTTTVSPANVVTSVSGGESSPAVGTTAATSATSVTTIDDNHFIEGQASVDAGHDIRCVAIVGGTVKPKDSKYVIPQSVVWDISETSGKKTKMGTFIDPEGVLHTDPAEENTSVTVRATTTYVEPSKPMAEQSYKSATREITIVPCKKSMRTSFISMGEPVALAEFEEESQPVVKKTATKKATAKKIPSVDEAK